MKIVIMPIRGGGDYLANMSHGTGVSGSLSAPTLHELLVKLAEQTRPDDQRSISEIVDRVRDALRVYADPPVGTALHDPDAAFEGLAALAALEEALK